MSDDNETQATREELKEAIKIFRRAILKIEIASDSIEEAIEDLEEDLIRLDDMRT